jgi:hypothetical protein
MRADAGGFAAWFESGRIVDAILAFMLLEAVLLLAYRARTGRGVGAADLLANLAAGATLLLALRAALVGGTWLWVAAALAAALVAHLADLSRRWQR